MKKDRLQIAVKHADVLFKKIMNKYDQLGGYLVLSSETDQCSISDDPTAILKNLPFTIFPPIPEMASSFTGSIPCMVHPSTASPEVVNP